MKGLVLSESVFPNDWYLQETEKIKLLVYQWKQSRGNDTNFSCLLCSDGQGISTSHSTDLSEMEERQDAGKMAEILLALVCELFMNQK